MRGIVVRKPIRNARGIDEVAREQQVVEYLQAVRGKGPFEAPVADRLIAWLWTIESPNDPRARAEFDRLHVPARPYGPADGGTP